MTFDEMTSALEKGRLSAGAYLVLSGSPYYGEKLREKLQHGQDDERLEFFAADSMAAETLSQELSSRDMFSDGKIFVITKAELYAGEKCLETAVQQAKEGGTAVIFYTESESAGRKKPFSLIPQEQIVKGPRLYEKQISAILKERFRQKGFDITPDALQRFIEINENSVTILMQEADKFMLYLGDQKKAATVDLDHFSGSFAKWTIFDCLDKLRDKRKSDFFTYLTHILKSMDTGEILAFLSLLFNEVKKMLLVHAYQKETNKILAGRLGMHPYLFELKNYKLTSLRHSRRALLQTLTLFTDADIQLKTGDDPYLVIRRLTRYLFE
ncbi:MAG TPA: hypothetical protein ENN72_01175 [Firmicutes bacterium]|nr:hypothetical protein [Bacillota bacterium]